MTRPIISRRSKSWRVHPFHLNRYNGCFVLSFPYISLKKLSSVVEWNETLNTGEVYYYRFIWSIREAFWESNKVISFQYYPREQFQLYIEIRAQMYFVKKDRIHRETRNTVSSISAWSAKQITSQSLVLFAHRARNQVPSRLTGPADPGRPSDGRCHFPITDNGKIRPEGTSLDWIILKAMTEIDTGIRSSLSEGLHRLIWLNHHQTLTLE